MWTLQIAIYFGDGGIREARENGLEVLVSATEEEELPKQTYCPTDTFLLRALFLRRIAAFLWEI